MKCIGSPSILIADDNPINLKVLKSILEDKGYGVTSAANEAQALSRIRQAPPDLIILDIHMPKMNELQVIDALKKTRH